MTKELTKTHIETNQLTQDGGPFGSTAHINCEFTRAHNVPSNGSLKGEFCVLNNDNGALRITIEGTPLPADFPHGQYGISEDLTPENKAMKNRTIALLKKLSSIAEAIKTNYFEGEVNLRAIYDFAKDGRGQPTTKITSMELQMSGTPNGHPHWTIQKNQLN